MGIIGHLLNGLLCCVIIRGYEIFKTLLVSGDFFYIIRRQIMTFNVAKVVIFVHFVSEL